MGRYRGLRVLVVWVLVGSMSVPLGAANLDAVGPLVEAGRFDEAEQILTAAQDWDGEPEKSVAALGMLGDLRARQGNWDGALEAFDALAAKAPNFGFAHYRRGMVLSRFGDRQEAAVAAFERAVQVGCDEPDIDMLLGFATKNLGDAATDPATKKKWFDRARIHLNAAVASNPDDIRALGNLADLAFNCRDFPAALAGYEKVRAQAPDNEVMLCRLANTYLRMGNASAAVRLLKQVMTEADPPTPPPVEAGSSSDLNSADLMRSLLAGQVRAMKCAVLAEACLGVNRPDEALLVIKKLRATLGTIRLPAGASMPELETLRETADRLEAEAVAAGGKKGGSPPRR